MFSRKIKVYHECELGCPKCWGSGEGWYEGSNCNLCHGSGVSWSNGAVEKEFEIEWSTPDLSDLEIVDGYNECPDCEQNLFQYVKEELEWQLKNGH